MPLFKYAAKDKDGRTVRGFLEVKDRAVLIDTLRSKELIIVSVAEEKPKARFSFTIRKMIKIDDLVIFSRQLATMVAAGISLVQALDILAEQLENKTFREVVSRMRDDIEAGSSLSEAAARHPRVFSNLFPSMVKAGEKSGMLDEILDRLAGYMEKSSSLQRKVKSSLVYPAVVVSMAVLITAFLILKVVPTFKGIFTTLGGTLPLPTQILIFVSDNAQRYFPYFVGVVVITGFGLVRYINTEKGRLQFDTLLLKLPVFGVLLQKVAIAKFTRTLATLIRSGVPILGSLEIVASTAGNKLIETAVTKARSSIREGETIADPLGKSGVFPPMVVRMISIGEQTGELEKMLTKIADFYEEQVDAAVSGLTSLIEPLIILFLGIVVGSIVIAMFMPIFKMTELIR